MKKNKSILYMWISFLIFYGGWSIVMLLLARKILKLIGE